MSVVLAAKSCTSSYYQPPRDVVCTSEADHEGISAKKSSNRTYRPKEYARVVSLSTSSPMPDTCRCKDHCQYLY